MTTYSELQARVRALNVASDEAIAADYECDLSEVADVRQNVAENIEADRIAAGIMETLDWLDGL